MYSAYSIQVQKQVGLRAHCFQPRMAFIVMIKALTELFASFDVNADHNAIRSKWVGRLKTKCDASSTKLLNAATKWIDGPRHVKMLETKLQRIQAEQAAATSLGRRQAVRGSTRDGRPPGKT